MKVLVTGGAGFIGSNFIYDCIAHEPTWELVCLDALTYAGNLATLVPALETGRARFVRGNMIDRNCVFSLFEQEKFDAVVHFAAESHVDNAIRNPAGCLQTNVMGTQVLLDAARTFGNVRYHQISTDEVYGDLPLDRPDLLFREDSPLHCSSPYSASKASADLLCLAYMRTFNLPVTVSRCSNNYGPYQHPEKLIPLMISKALANEPLPVYGNGANVRDWLHVCDHCKAVRLILKNGTPGETYNIGGHNERDNLTVVKTILAALGKPESQINFIKDRAGHDLRYAIDPTKIQRKLGWLPETPFEQGIAETIAWYRSNKNWWQPVLDGSYVKNNDDLCRVFGA